MDDAIQKSGHVYLGVSVYLAKYSTLMMFLQLRLLCVWFVSSLAYFSTFSPLRNPNTLYRYDVVNKLANGSIISGYLKVTPI